MHTLFCDVKAGKNICKICQEEAYYPTRDPSGETITIADTTLSVMQLFRCGHGMCLRCYEKMCETSEFSCPFCRNKGTAIIETFGSPAIRRHVHTIRDFLDEWKGRMYLLRFTKHPYMLLHNQIIREAVTKRRLEISNPKRYPKRYPKKKKKRRRKK